MSSSVRHAAGHVESTQLQARRWAIFCCDRHGRSFSNVAGASLTSCPQRLMRKHHRLIISCKFKAQFGDKDAIYSSTTHMSDPFISCEMLLPFSFRCMHLRAAATQRWRISAHKPESENLSLNCAMATTTMGKNLRTKNKDVCSHWDAAYIQRA